MSEESSSLQTAAFEKLSKIKIRTNLLTIGMIVAAALWIDHRVSNWERTLAGLETHCWRVDDQIEFAHELESGNKAVAIVVPEPRKIIQLREPKQRE